MVMMKKFNVSKHCKSSKMKITNMEDADGDLSSDPRLAAFLAVHLVRQILDDAYVIANSATQSCTNQTWRYHSIVKNEQLCDSDDNEEVVSSKTGNDNVVNENEVEQVANLVATSTPQKVTDENSKHKPESSLIGQGDEDLDMRTQNELATSMFINHLFDMSEVETVIVCDDAEMVQSNSESNELLTQAMTKIMDSYINAALGIALKLPSQTIDGDANIERSSSTEYSEYSLMSDAFDDDVGKHIAFYIHDTDEVIGNGNNECEVPHIVPAVKIEEIYEERCVDRATKNDVARFESAYLSLNRDYEQCLEDDGNVILDDPRCMTLQEVELLTANTSDENLCQPVETESEAKCDNIKELKATSAVSAGSKKSLVNRCRTQGARLLACIRGWWRRKTPGKRKEHQHRVPGSVRGICPLSPDARRRAASLIDQRILRSPSPSRGVDWKFNTVNEALVNSTRWKDYTFDVKPEECGEF